MHYLLGIDLGSSSAKASIVELESGRSVASAQSPSLEMDMISLQPGWAEQDPNIWWEHVCNSVRMALKNGNIAGGSIECIGITYQMHGLVCIDRHKNVIRPSIIWCDSRAVSIGQQAFMNLGEKYCLEHLLNSPGNFTASKLKWVMENEQEKFEGVDKFMLPGDFINLSLTGEVNTTASGLSEGVFWDFKENSISRKLLEHYDIPQTMVPEVVPTFSIQGKLLKNVAEDLGLKAGVPVTYRAGDQPNNAFSLNVLNPGEMATTAGTSGVIYSVTDKDSYDPKSRVNTFIHVNDSFKSTGKRNGILLCINGTGILNNWARKILSNGSDKLNYEKLNELAERVPIGAEGLAILPFGNGAERILENREIASSMSGINFNLHNQNHVARAAQEGIVYSLNYGLEIIKGMGASAEVTRAGLANMFLSPIFRDAFVNTTGVTLELYNTDGATGAAIGAGIGSDKFDSFDQAFKGLQKLETLEPEKDKMEKYKNGYLLWLKQLNQRLSS